MRFDFNSEEIGTGDSALRIGINGFQSSPEDPEGKPTQVLIDVYDGKLRVHVWDGSSGGPQSIVIEPVNATAEELAAKQSRNLMEMLDSTPTRRRTIPVLTPGYVLYQSQKKMGMEDFARITFISMQLWTRLHRDILDFVGSGPYSKQRVIEKLKEFYKAHLVVAVLVELESAHLLVLDEDGMLTLSQQGEAYREKPEKFATSDILLEVYLSELTRDQLLGKFTEDSATDKYDDQETEKDLADLIEDKVLITSPDGILEIDWNNPNLWGSFVISERSPARRVTA